MKRWAGDEPALYKRDISIDTRFCFLRSSMNGNAYHPVGMRYGGSAQENEIAKSGFIVPVLLDFTNKGIILACADDVLILFSLIVTDYQLLARLLVIISKKMSLVSEAHCSVFLFCCFCIKLFFCDSKHQLYSILLINLRC